MSEQEPVGLRNRQTTPVDMFDNFRSEYTHPVLQTLGISRRTDNQVRRKLRGYREAAGLTMEQTIKQLDWSYSKLHRTENGLNVLKTASTLAMLSVYGVTDKDEQQAILGTVRKSQLVNRSFAYHKLVTTIQREAMECEGEAESVTIFAPTVLPDILQTPSMAQNMRTVFEPEQSADDQEDLEQLRSARASYMLSSHGPRIDLILDEDVIRRAQIDNPDHPEARFDEMNTVICGIRRLEALRQGKPLLEADCRLNSNISVRIAPCSIGAYAKAKFPYTIFDFENPEEPSEVYMIGITSNALTHDTKIVDEHRRAFDALGKRIPPPEATSGILKNIEAGQAAQTIW